MNKVKYLLDTDICIYLIKNKSPELIEKVTEKDPGEIGISAITLAELRLGIAKSKNSEKNSIALEKMLRPIEILPFDENAAFAYGEVRKELEKAGTPIGPMDCLIASHAFSIDATVVTNNEREFKRVKKLKTENWS